jgi:hypothetical protein
MSMKEGEEARRREKLVCNSSRTREQDNSDQRKEEIKETKIRNEKKKKNEG